MKLENEEKAMLVLEAIILHVPMEKLWANVEEATNKELLIAIDKLITAGELPKPGIFGWEKKNIEAIVATLKGKYGIEYLTPYATPMYPTK